MLFRSHNVAAQLVFAAGRSDVSDVWIDGNRVLKSFELTNVNVADLRARVAERVKALDAIR